MPRYSFTISAGEEFSVTQDLPDDGAAREQAIRTMRDAESALRFGALHWSLIVTKDDVLLFRIDVRAQQGLVVWC